MPIQTWDGLQKNATTDTTIEQFIADQIALHEADPEAHLGVGESIEQHKMAEVIDHPMASIVADKIGASDVVYTFNFETIDNFPDSTNLNMNYSGNPYLVLEYGYSNSAYVEFSQETIENTYDDSKTMSISFGCRIENIDSHLTGYFAYHNLRFSIVSGVLKARFYRATAYNEVDLSTVNLSLFHFYKIIYLPIDNMAYFYVDGVLVASIARPAGSAISGNYFPVFSFTTNGGIDMYVRFANLIYTRES